MCTWIATLVEKTANESAAILCSHQQADNSRGNPFSNASIHRLFI
jgi:hypothetical protein